jgi:hypothetical protein
LPQEVPALIELDADGFETNPVVVREIAMLIEAFFLLRQ